MKKTAVAAIVALLALSIGPNSAHAGVVSDDLILDATTFDHNGLTTHVIGPLSSPSVNPATDAHRYEIARVTVNTHHWADTGPIFVELYQTYYGPNSYLKFMVTAGYLDFNGSVTLLEQSGVTNRVNVSLGAPVPTGTSSSGYPNHYIPIYVETGYYSRWMAKLTHGWIETESSIPERERIRVFDTPSPTVLANTVPVPGGEGKLSSFASYVGRLGIGTTNPQSALHVIGDVRVDGSVFADNLESVGSLNLNGGSATSPGISFAGDGNTGFFSPAADTLAIASGGAERLRVGSNGYIGIGTSTPSTKLDVNGSIRSMTSGIAEIRLTSTGSPSSDWEILTGYPSIGSAQNLGFWNSTGSKLTITPSGNIGLGTNTPAARLEIAGGFLRLDEAYGIQFSRGYPNDHGRIYVNPSDGTRMRYHGYYGHKWSTQTGVKMTLSQTGSLGLGTESPQAMLEVGGQFRVTGLGPIPTSGKGIEMYWSSSNNLGDIFAYDRNANAMMSLRLRGSKILLDSGNVGIGTTNTDDYKLSVAGKVRAEEVVVYTGWADYVFEKDYALPTLDEVETHIEQHGHLPGVPSATEVEANGVSIGDTQRILLEKIEELTLYVIELQKQNNKQEKRIAELSAALERGAE